jgi:Tfp pilus assembly protein PilO
MMSAEMIVVLLIVVLAVAGLAYLEINSRRNQRSEKNSKEQGVLSDE